TNCDDRQRMYRLVHSQRLTIRPREQRREHPNAGHLLRVIEGRELHKLGTRRRLAPSDEVRERKPNPRHNHRPRFDAPQAINPLLEHNPLENILEVPHARLVALALYRHGPWFCRQAFRKPRGRTLIGAVLVEVVVRGDLLPSISCLHGAQRTGADAVEFATTLRRGLGGEHPSPRQALGGDEGARGGNGLDELTGGPGDRLGGNLRTWAVG